MDTTQVFTLAILALVVGAAAGFWLGGRAERARAVSAQAALRRELDADRVAQEARFQSVAAQALDANTDRFLTLAEQRLARSAAAQRTDLDRGTKQVTDLVEPLAAALDDVAKELRTAEQQRTAAQASLAAELASMRQGSTELGRETSRLVTALRASEKRGAWGETQLRRVVEAAGMLNRVDFDEQVSVTVADGKQRPDMIVHLAGGKNVVVDAKVPLLAFLDATTDDDAAREDSLNAHVRQFRAHVDSLAAKEYWNQFSPAPEFVIMFVPAESIFAAAIQRDPSLFDAAFDRKVVIATPMTLLAILRTIAYAWRQEALAGNAQRVLDVGKELHDRLATMGGHLAGLGKSIEKAADAYNRTVGTLETRVFVSARKLADLEVVDTPAVCPEPAEVSIRNLSAAELITGMEMEVA